MFIFKTVRQRLAEDRTSVEESREELTAQRVISAELADAIIELAALIAGGEQET